MPYIKSISIHQTVNRSIAYILNPDKTKDLMYATSLNCMTNAADAYLAMRTVYEHFSGYKFNEPIPLKGKGRVKAIHYIQSFDPSDNVSPELAHKIAKAFALKTFGEDCQIVIAASLSRKMKSCRGSILKISRTSCKMILTCILYRRILRLSIVTTFILLESLKGRFGS